MLCFLCVVCVLAFKRECPRNDSTRDDATGSFEVFLKNICGYSF